VYVACNLQERSFGVSHDRAGKKLAPISTSLEYDTSQEANEDTSQERVERNSLKSGITRRGKSGEPQFEKQVGQGDDKEKKRKYG